MIRIARVKPYSELLRYYKIYIDGIYRGKIGVGETQEFDVENGNHMICAKLDWTRSNELCVNVDNSIVDVEVGSSVVGWRLLLWRLYATVWRKKALWLRMKEDVDVPSKGAK